MDDHQYRTKPNNQSKLNSIVGEIPLRNIYCLRLNFRLAIWNFDIILLFMEIILVLFAFASAYISLTLSLLLLMFTIYPE